MKQYMELNGDTGECRMSVWTGEDTSKFVEQPPEIKVNPNGCDLKISEIWKMPENGVARIHGSTRTITPDKILIEPEKDGFYYLPEGTYEIRVANKITIPEHAVGLLFPRTTFNRLGVIKSESGIWDSGYSGFGTQTIRVTVGELQVHKDEYWFQFILMDTKEKVKQLYKGHWQGERPVGHTSVTGEKPKGR
jgi:deoxycytidine triphosphate deaminase